jgi:MFS transporter, SP family, general alpha glucoside:H+ symporter
MLCFSAAFVFVTFFAPSEKVLYIGLLLQGIPWGIFQVVSPAYASEVASFQLRPVLTTWNNACWVVGQLIGAGIAKGFGTGDTAWAYRIPFALQWVF